jgi:NTE family protein
MNKIGLALSSGFARGFAHIGILKSLEKNNIPISCIAGTSIGALIGACYAVNPKIKDLEKIGRNFDIKDFIDVKEVDKGLVEGDKILKYLSIITNDADFCDVKIPLKIIAVNVKTGKRVIFNKGNIAEAIRASISYPGIFTPANINNKLYLDGGLIDPIPVDALNNVNKIIAVDLSLGNFRDIFFSNENYSNDFIDDLKQTFIDMGIESFKNYAKENKIKLPFLFKRLILKPSRINNLMNIEKTPEIFKIVLNSFYIMNHEITRSELQNKKIDLIIKPKIDDVRILDFNKINYCIKKGEEATNILLPKIRKLLH